MRPRLWRFYGLRFAQRLSSGLNKCISPTVSCARRYYSRLKQFCSNPTLELAAYFPPCILNRGDIFQFVFVKLVSQSAYADFEQVCRMGAVAIGQF
jgi:hypothetical protein